MKRKKFKSGDLVVLTTPYHQALRVVFVVEKYHVTPTICILRRMTDGTLFYLLERELEKIS